MGPDFINCLTNASFTSNFTVIHSLRRGQGFVIGRASHSVATSLNLKKPKKLGISIDRGTLDGISRAYQIPT